LTSSPEAMSTSIRPPTPAPSPTPNQRAPDWSTAAEHEDSQIKNTRSQFSEMTRDERLRLLGELLNLCDNHELSFVAEFVSPRLKKDPFMELPTELCLRVCLITISARTSQLISTDFRMYRRTHNAGARLTGLSKVARAGQRRYSMEVALSKILVSKPPTERRTHGGRGSYRCLGGDEFFAVAPTPRISV
jgi:hypothetical protein